MGQYYKIVNLTKKEFLAPFAFGEGVKLLEFGCDGCGTMTALACLLANSNGRGGGDLDGEHPLIGSWAGDSIVIAGDYAEAGDIGETDPDADPSAPYMNLYDRCYNGYFKDISEPAVAMVKGDPYVASILKKRGL